MYDLTSSQHLGRVMAMYLVTELLLPAFDADKNLGY
jgi:hypothetical protein